MKGLRTSACTGLLCLQILVARDLAVAQNPDPTAPAKYGFAFRNFVDSMFSWDIYCHSFFGVPLDPNLTWATATFDRLFYELAFKTKLPDPAGNHSGAGNCFGISLMSLMMNRFGGYYGYCSPTNAYKGDTNWNNPAGPNDRNLRRVINIMHGRQLSVAALETYLDQAQSGHSQKSYNGYQLAEEAIAKEGPCLVSISAQANPADGSGGHTLIAYGVTKDSGGHGRIWVVDPNRLWVVPTPKDRGWYQGDSNHIDCDLGSGSWRFRMAGFTADWPVGAGNIIIIPLSLVGPPGRVPSSLGLSMGDLLNKLFLSDGTGERCDEEIIRHKPLPPDR
jgi:hypothetical protein